jgi:hypothetical protein
MLLLFLSSQACLAQVTQGRQQASRGLAKAAAFKDSSAAAVMAEFRRDTSFFRQGPDIIKAAQKAGQSAKADALADSLANVAIAFERTAETRELSRAEIRVSSQALLALHLSGVGSEPYTGAADRLIRIYRESKHTGIFGLIMLVDHRKGADFLKGIAVTNDVAAISALRALCGASSGPEVSVAGHASAKAAILDLFDRKLLTYDNSMLRSELNDCVNRIRGTPSDRRTRYPSGPAMFP